MRQRIREERKIIQQLNNLLYDTQEKVVGLDVFKLIYEHELIIRKENKYTGNYDYFMIIEEPKRDPFGGSAYQITVTDVQDETERTVFIYARTIDFEEAYRRKCFFGYARYWQYEYLAYGDTRDSAIAASKLIQEGLKAIREAL